MSIDVQNQYEVISQPRHNRVVFFIDGGYDSNELRKLIMDNLRLWGGRYNPIVPLTDGKLTDQWREVMSFYDPDYVGYTSGLSEESIIQLCEQIGFNPRRVFNIDDPADRRAGLRGVFCGCLIPTIYSIFDERESFVVAQELWKCKSPTLDFYKINFLLEDHFGLSSEMLGKHEKVYVTPENFQDINKILGEKRIYNSTRLSALNSRTTILRARRNHFLYPELIIAKDENANEDFLYHWNKQLFTPPNITISSLIVTVEQVALLIQDPQFQLILYRLPSESKQINLVSFSLDEAELNAMADKLRTFAKSNSFHVDKALTFPFEVLDAGGGNPFDYKEKVNIQIIPSRQHLITNTKLTFDSCICGSENEWFLDLDIKELDNRGNTKLFPTNADTIFMSRTDSRIKRDRTLTVCINHKLWVASVIELSIPNFYSTISLLVTAPREINKRQKYIYSEIAYNDSSRRLVEFLKLFKNVLGNVDNIIFDKFWSDLFYELTNNIKTEGDTITFDEIFAKAVAIFEGGLKTKEESFKYPDSLRKGLTRFFQDFINNKVFLPGYVVKCKACSSGIWYSLKEMNTTIQCKGCGHDNHFKAETPVSYKLNHLVKNNIGLRTADGKFMPDGNWTVIKTLCYLSRPSNSFEYLPQIDVYKNYEDRKPVTDIDITCLVNGKLYIGECKHSSPLFFETSNKSLNNLLMLAETMKPDCIILSCSEDQNDKLRKAAQYLNHHLSRANWNKIPEVQTYMARDPDYFHWGGTLYFQ